MVLEDDLAGKFLAESAVYLPCVADTACSLIFPCFGRQHESFSPL